MIVKNIQREVYGVVHSLWPTAFSDVLDVVIEQPKDHTKGDFSTTVAFHIAKSTGLRPDEVARTIVEKLPTGEYVAGSVGPYINFTLDKSEYSQFIISCSQGVSVPAIFSGERILVEHSSPNLFKSFHIGHLVNNTVGESVVRLMRASGADVVTMSYPSDISLGIAKAVWGMQEKFPDVLDDDTLTTVQKMRYAGDAYAYGVQEYDVREDVVRVVREITQALYRQDEGNDYFALYTKGRAINISYFEKVVTRLGSQFDAYIKESETGSIGKDIVESHTGDVFTKSGDTTIFEGEKYGLHTRVFITKEGLPTYESKDIGLLHEKFVRFSPDRSLFVTDHEQGPYFQVVKKAAGLINPEWEEKTTHITHGRLALKGVKISSRLGNVPLAEDIIDGVVESTRSAIEQSVHSRGDVDIDGIAIGALKFAILKVSLGKNMIFDAEQSLSFEGDSGPYVQYTHARCRSIVAKAREAGISLSGSDAYDEGSHGVVWQLMGYQNMSVRAMTEIAPHMIVQYLLELCHAYNKYYNDHKIIDVTQKDKSAYRATVTLAVAETLQHGLDLLGINAPGEM